MASQPDEDELWGHSEAAKKLNALYANRIFAQPLGEGMVRISFGEMKEAFDPEYHSAIVATPELALEFAEVIQRVALNVIQMQQDYAAFQKDEQEAADLAAREAAIRAAQAVKPDGNGDT